MFGRRWRSKYELLYITKHNLKSSLPTIVMAIWTSSMMIFALSA